MKRFFCLSVLLLLVAMPICSAQAKDVSADQAKSIQAYADTLVSQIKGGSYETQAVENFLQGNMAEMASAAYSQSVDLGKVIRDIRAKHEQSIAEEVAKVNKGERDKDDQVYWLTEAIEKDFLNVPRETAPDLSKTGMTSTQLLGTVYYTERNFQWQRRYGGMKISRNGVLVPGIELMQDALGGNLDTKYFVSEITGPNHDQIMIGIMSEGENGIRPLKNEALYRLWIQYYGLEKKEKQVQKPIK